MIKAMIGIAADRFKIDVKAVLTAVLPNIILQFYCALELKISSSARVYNQKKQRPQVPNAWFDPHGELSLTGK